MAKLNWEAANRRSLWAYTPTLPGKAVPRHKQRISPNQAAIEILSRRINKGRIMIAELPLGDPRYDKWRNHLLTLIEARKALRSSRW